MKKLGLVFFTLFALFFSPFSMAADMKIGYVNVTDLYNKSKFVEKANKALQDKVKSMEEQLQAQRKKIQDLVANYEKNTASEKKESIGKKITAEQSTLADMTQKFQKKIQSEQNAGMQNFTKLVQQAVVKIAKDKGINNVLNSSAVIYTDESWIDLTQETAAAMQN